MKRWFWFGLLLWVGIIATLFAVDSAAGAKTALPTMPSFVEPTKFRIWNAGSEEGVYTTYIRTGGIEGAGALVYSNTVSLLPAQRQSYELKTITQIVAPFDGHADVEATQAIGYEYYLLAGNANVTLRNLTATTVTIWLRYQDGAGVTLQEYTLSLAANEVKRLRAVDYPPPGGWARVEFAGSGAFDRWYAAMLSDTRK